MAAPSHAPSPRRVASHADSDTMIGPFLRLESIGKGSFAQVYRGVHTVSLRLLFAPPTLHLQSKQRSLVAIKSVTVSKLNKKLKDNLFTEIQILRSLNHPHIVALIDCKEATAYMHIVMEFCELGDLSTFIKKRTTLADHPATADMMRKYPNPPVGGLNEVIARHFLKQLASAMEFLRAKNYVHRDLKPQNLLLNPSPYFYEAHRPEAMPMAAAENSMVPAVGIMSLPMLKVADFGFARFLPATSLAETLCGSPLYMAPEILRYEKYDSKADLWSAGTVLHEMLMGKPPFRASNHVELLRKIEKQDDRIRFDEVHISRDMKSLVRALLKKTPTERMSYEAFFDDIVVRGDIPGLAPEDRPKERDEIQPEGKPGSTEKPERTERPEEHVTGRSSVDPAYSSSPRQRPSPSSRQTYNAPAAPPASSNARRYSNSPLPQAQERPPQAQQERRPAMTSHATAPARPAFSQDRPTSAAAVTLARRSSRHSPSPGSSMLREHFERERNPQRAEEQVAREARDRVAQEIAFERDYVLVEKKSVEVNAFADELAASPQFHRDRPRSPQHGAMVRRATTQGNPTSTTGAQATPSRAIQIASGRQRPESIHQRASSYDRRYGPSPGSATSAISKALNMASYRVFGIGASPPSGRGPSPPKGYSAFPMYPTAQNNSVLLIGEGGKSVSTAGKDKDTRTLEIVEELAHRSHVIYGFAEVKYKQLLPAPPSDQGLGIVHGGAGRSEGDANPAFDDDLTVDAILTISEEALVLYVKALSLLAKSVDLAGTWWGQRNKGEAAGDGMSARSSPANANVVAIGAKMNHVVQWVRARFNECVEKSEFVGRKLQDAQKQLPVDHPFHPSNLPSTSTSIGSAGTSAENIHLPTGITAEKLMYDRAIEMSRQAAVNELVNEDLPGCELNYATAIRMLEAILDGEEESSTRRSGASKRDGKQGEVAIDGLETEDRQEVMKLIDSMRTRLKALKKKMEAQRAGKRASITAAPSSQGRSSPSTTPLTAHTPQ
ncbi:unc51-like kinase [Saccharata proteae CBS 121410]|uniref:non-specific serine/threonine protein kinase n=1 Tax=Saccharata proteae CBS 121410 TaxID=1314787 RepID=A0A9P4HPQ9_9PEZI|nr:unc51-like kinase [Saccharata proteae CBS 121410]